MGRDGKKGKGRGGRGGGGGRGSESRMFIENEDELEIRQRVVSEQREARAKRRGEEIVKDADGAEEEEGENEQEEAPDSVFTFEKTKAALPNPGVKAGGDEDDEDISGGLVGHNPNRNRPIEADPNNPEVGMSRREREALAAQKAKEDYMRRHLAGETEQAKKDLERLALIRAKREQAKQQREAEGRAPGWTKAGVESSDEESSDEDEGEKKPAATKSAPAPAPVSEAVAKKKAAAAGEGETPATAADGGPPKLKAMDIKKLNGDQLKEHLKARGLDIQGQKKDLIKRLSDYEAARA
mmetsp:Transcript_9564/g.10285  ORF Transcript_9564/g.10285 Transcript_9564/m.10285 type:complete len:297 (+) Transcript_9564:42-932(+)|eukprot:CAMPEP_0173151330 /NCGR_PEP_ID=MMETSP1105-20130129/11505_1 /TAXON_ID=2985 /ORGANISM="Ochromonas sp., Strain BG-1" /LENGTH=296 /DNA_ID=CAMNT_0014066663 /DNA_START=42 /DNA_END=932 /DNA_ORIENTATION=-